MSVTRFGVSLEEEILNALDEYAQQNGFANRSRAIRFLIEKNLVEEKWKCDNMVAGVITLVYGHEHVDVAKRTAELQRQYNNVVLSVQRFYLNEVNTMELFAVKGTSRNLTELSDKLVSIKGIQHGKLTMSKEK